MFLTRSGVEWIKLETRIWHTEFVHRYQKKLYLLASFSANESGITIKTAANEHRRRKRWNLFHFLVLVFLKCELVKTANASHSMRFRLHQTLELIYTIRLSCAAVRWAWNRVVRMVLRAYVEFLNWGLKLARSKTVSCSVPLLVPNQRSEVRNMYDIHIFFKDRIMKN